LQAQGTRDNDRKPWIDEVVEAADAVITMGCGDASPSSLASATKNGSSTIPQEWTLRPSDPSERKSSVAY